MSPFDLAETATTLATAFSERFPATRCGVRTVGREAEFPLVTSEGEAGDVRRLWQVLMREGDLEPVRGAGPPGQRDIIVALTGPDYTYTMEVGLGTIEISTRPCTTLFELAEILERAVRRLVHTAARFSWRVLGYGIQPVTPPQLSMLSPKQRYLSLYRAMGAQWLWYTVTAADHLHVSLTRTEMVPMLNFCNLMTPVIIALCANSPILRGRLSPYCSAREGQMAEIYAREHRHGMLARPFSDMVDFVCTLSHSTYLVVRADNQVVPSSRPFLHYLAENGPDLDAFLFHEHYIWNSARLRAAYGTIEIRPACQQPWNENMGAAALGLGLVEAAGEIEQYVRESLGTDYWDQMRRYHARVVRHGLRAPQPAPDFLFTILERAAHALRGRGFGEDNLLSPLVLRLERGMNPAQRARAVFQIDGMAGLLRHSTIRPTTRSSL